MGKGETLVSGGIDIEVSDVSEQKVAKVGNIPYESTVGELIQGLLSELDLPLNDSHQRPLTYHARLEREGRHLHASETVGEALQSGDRVVLQPNIDAGGKGRKR
jgi:hypothetical protein